MKTRAHRQNHDDKFIDKLDAFIRTPNERAIHESALTRAVLALPTQLTVTEQDIPFAQQWVRFGHVDERGRRMIDRFVEALAPAAGSPDALAAARWKAIWYSVFAVRGTEGAHVVVEDLVLGGRYRVPLDRKSASLSPAHTLLSWMEPDGDRARYLGSPVGVQASKGPWLVERVREMMEMHRHNRQQNNLPVLDDRGLLREMAWSLQIYIRVVSSDLDPTSLLDELRAARSKAEAPLSGAPSFF